MFNPWNQWGAGLGTTPPNAHFGHFSSGFDPRSPGVDGIEETLLEAERARALQGPRGFAPEPYGPRPFFGPVPFGIDDYRLDPRWVLEEIRRCGRGLQSVAEDLDGPESPAQYRACLLATRYLFYVLGLCVPRGIVLPPDLTQVERTERSITRGSTCKAAGQAIEKYVRQQLGGRSTGTEVGDLVAKLRDCWDQLTKD